MNSEKERRYLIGEEDLPIVLVHGTMGKSEDWSRGSLTLQAMDPSPIAPLRKFAYNASKAAVNVFTIHLAAELKDTNIKVNSVHPGWVKTALGSEAAPVSVPDGAKTTVAVALLGSDSPNGRFIHEINKELPW
jgi:NAD(P)-dependent dehydrogenase (short-subunit alcohol dehydrogenase family)